MMDSQKPTSLFLLALGVFIMLDSLLAIVFGSSYILWGLEYTPAAYQALIIRLSRSRPLVLFLVKLVEFAAGFILFRFAWRLSGYVGK